MIRITIAHLVSLFFILPFVFPQDRTCYTTCRLGFCLPTDPLSCTGCDSGLLNVNQRCLSSDIQPSPTQFLVPLNFNTLVADGDRVLCNINDRNASTSMIFSLVSGRSINRVFQVNVIHDYIQIKFNAIIITGNPLDATLNYKIRVNDQSIINRNPTIVRPPNNTAVLACNTTLAVDYPFFIVERFSQSRSNIVLEISLSSPDDNDGFSIASVLLFYGSCNSKCSKCFGPSQNDCQTCRGFYLSIVNNSCSNCPEGFYDSGQLCLSCPFECLTCNLANGVPVCISCDPFITVSASDCRIKYTSISSLTSAIFSESDGWSSSEIVGNPVTRCGLYSLIGGDIIGREGSRLFRKFTGLTPHNEVWIKFNLLVIDQIPDVVYRFLLLVDNQSFDENFTINLGNNNLRFTDQCGGDSADFIRKVYRTNISHSDSSLTVSISGLGTYFGIRDFMLGIVNLTNVPTCNPTINISCLQCPTDSYIFEFTCNICPIFCKTCVNNGSINAPKCLSCQSPFVFDQILGCIDLQNQLLLTELIGNTGITNSEWSSYPKLPNKALSTCGSSTIVGASDIFYRRLTLSRIFKNIPPHEGIEIHFHFYQIDNFPTLQSLYFLINKQRVNYTLKTPISDLCGNSSLDSIQKIYLSSANHTDNTLQFQIHGDFMSKFGISDILVFLSSCPSCTNANGLDYILETLPVYSINTPPNKGLLMRYTFTEKVRNITNLQNVFSITNTKAPQNVLPFLTTTFKKNQQFKTIVGLNDNLINEKVVTKIQNPRLVITSDSQRNIPLRSSIRQTSFGRYDDIRQDQSQYRSNIRNLTNFFTGCALFGMFVGMISFIFGMSCAFDDFFLLCQLIFVHVFIGSSFNPPTYKIPIGGMQMIQFMAWLPNAARTAIQSGIIPQDLNQYSPLVYQQFYTDVVFARTIYHTILFLLGIIILFIILKLISMSYNSILKENSYFRQYYYYQQNRTLVFIDKVVRFVFFTFMWASTLQFMFFQNSPQPFFIWNSVLLIVCFVGVAIYPLVIGAYILYKTNLMVPETFAIHYQDLRIDYDRWWYFPIRYYYFLFVAVIIATQWNSNSLGSLLPLLFVHIAYGIFIIVAKPFGMKQQTKLTVYFYNNYPTIYLYTSAIQQFLFALFEILLLALYGQRNSQSNSYLSLGYGIDFVIILLLINGFIRMFWGLMKQIQGCNDGVIENDLRIARQNDNVNYQQQQKILIQIEADKNERNNGKNSRIDNFRKPSIAQLVK